MSAVLAGMATDGSMGAPLISGRAALPWRSRPVVKIALAMSAVAAIFGAFFFVDPSTFRSAASESPVSMTATSASVSEILMLYPKPSSIQEANEFFGRLPAHDMDEFVFQHIKPQAEHLFLNFLQEYGSTAPNLKTNMTTEAPIPRHSLEDKSEYMYRLGVFESSLRRIIELNMFEASHTLRPDRAVFAITQLADWTFEEFQTLLAGPAVWPSGTADSGPAPRSNTTRPFPSKGSQATADSLSCRPSKAETAWRMWGTKTCEQMQKGWRVCTNDKDVNHEQVMHFCPVTCSKARGEPCPCKPYASERKFRMWGTKTCQQMQDGWKVCTNDKDVNHAQIMARCPVTCARARGDPCPPPPPPSKKAPCTMNWVAKAPNLFVPRQQGACGSCYAHAVAETLRAVAAVNTGLKQDPGVLSAQFIMDCTGRGCKGGSESASMDYVAHHGGIPTKTAYGGYSGKNQKCKPHVKKAVTTSGHKSFFTEYDTANQLCKHGPLSIAVEANDAWKHYHSGVVTVKSCPAVGTNHAVQLVAVLQNKNAYMIRNSWGSGWGVNPTTFKPQGQRGFILLEYGTDTCHVTAGANFPENVEIIR